MKMKSTPVCLTTLVFAVGVSARGQEVKSAAEQGRDSEVLIPEIPQRFSEQLHFEMFLEKQSVGYATIAIAPIEGQHTWSYRVDTLVEMPGGGVRIAGEISATLSRRFEPQQITVRRNLILPNGAQRETTLQVDIGKDHVLLTKGVVGEGAPKAERLAHPDGPFVFGVEAIVQMTDVRAHPTFALREFDPAEGRIVVHQFKAEPDGKGGHRLESHKDTGEVGYQIALDSEGQVAGWSEPPVNITVRRCDEHRVKVLQQKLESR